MLTPGYAGPTGREMSAFSFFISVSQEGEGKSVRGSIVLHAEIQV